MILKTIYNKSENKFYFPIKGYFLLDETLKDKEIGKKYVKQWGLLEELKKNPEKFDIINN